ncbi:MAG: beta-lactamase family protein [Flavobacteriales bacterium]|nr:beta-lactamase family protein [Flavobacteriales bacterium]
MNKILLIVMAICLPIMIFAQSDIEAKIDSIIQFDSYIGQKPGLSIGIVKDGKTLFNKGYGLANLEYDIENTDSSVFDSASMAKQFTAACIWTLIDKGQLSLDDDIRKYLPEIPDFGDTIRIRHMLNHTSGLRNYSSILDLAGYNYLEHFFNNQSILELMSRQNGLNNMPGEKMIYGNTPFNLLTIIIERISGMRFKDFADKHLFIPLGMYSTTYRVDNSSIVKNRATGYIMEKDSIFSHFPRIESCYGGGSLWSTVEDLVLWSNLFTQPTKEYQDLVEFLLTKDTFNNGQSSNYSRGLNVDIYRGHNTIHHGGMTKGYRSQIITIPDIQLSVIILANYEEINPESLSYKIVDLFVTDSEIKQEDFVPYKHKSKELIEYVGMYQELNSCLKMEVIFKNDTLFAKSSLGRNYVPLKSKDKRTLCRFDNESVKYVFDKQMGSDLLVYFGATPFYFEKVILAEPSEINNNDYIGDYYSEELDVNYKVYIEESDLFLSYPNNPRVKLISGQQDEFGNGYRTRYTFCRNENGTVDRLKVASEGTVKDIEFRITNAKTK